MSDQEKKQFDQTPEDLLESLRATQEEMMKGIDAVTGALEEAISRSERYEDVVRDSKDAIFILDCDTAKIEEVNDAACSLLGYLREELLSMKQPDLYHEEDRSRMRYEYQRSVESGGVDGLQAQMMRKNGGKVAVSHHRPRAQGRQSRARWSRSSETSARWRRSRKNCAN